MAEQTVTTAKDNTLLDAPFLQSCRGEKTHHTPIWLMRQAGRYMPQYRAIREKHSMLTVIQTPELAAEVTLQPLEVFDLDAAIIFADILPPLIGMGLQLDFVKDIGPQIHNPIKTPDDIDVLTTPPAQAHLASTLKAITLVTKELNTRNIPLIGFAGAPFTLASYAIEGGGSKHYEKTKTLMYQHPAAWQRLMMKLLTVQADYLIEQAKAGAHVLQIFDSWVGLALGFGDFQRYVAPYNQLLVKKIKAVVKDVPIIYFSMGTSAYLKTAAQCGADVMGVDWRLPIHHAWHQLGDDAIIQGNLDPSLLLAPWREIQTRVDAILSETQSHDGYIFNVGQGLFPNTPMDTVKRLVDYVHEKTT